MRKPRHFDPDFSPDSNASLSLEMVVESPENVLVSYQLAGPAARCLAFGLDSIIRMLILVIVLLIAIWTSTFLPGLTWGIVLVLIFALEWGYHTISEGLFRGKTIGKDALGLRVVQLGGYPITFWSAMQRNMLRPVDGIPMMTFLALSTKTSWAWISAAPHMGDVWTVLLMMPVYGPALVAMVLSSRFQRLGDMAAGTVVISERDTRLIREADIISTIEPLSRREIGRRVPSDKTLGLIDEFLSRREELTHERGHQMCADFALALAEYLDFQGDSYQLRDYPMSFLARVYVTYARTNEEKTSSSNNQSQPVPLGNSQVVVMDSNITWE